MVHSHQQALLTLVIFLFHLYVVTSVKSAAVKSIRKREVYSQESVNGSCDEGWTKFDVTSELHICHKRPSSSCIPKCLPKMPWLNELLDEYFNLKHEVAELRTQHATCKGENDLARAEKEACDEWKRIISRGTTCPEGWVKHEDKCFKLFSDRLVNYNQAKQGCHGIHPGGATLVTIHSQGEQDFITDLIFNRWQLNAEASKENWATGMWLDAVDIGGVFRWVDGSLLTYANWSPNQPDHPNFELTLQMVMATPASRGKWNNNLASSLQFAVCQIKVDNCFKADPRPSIPM